MLQIKMAIRPVRPDVVLAVLLACTGQAAPQEAASSGGLSAWLDLADGAPVAGQSFDLRLRLLDATTGEPPLGLTLRSWIRPVEAGLPACTDAARAFRATGSLPRGVLDLDAPILAAVFSEGAVTLADPSLAQARATLRKAWVFSEPPVAMMADAATSSFLMAFAATGEVVRMDASDGSLTLAATGFDAPSDMIVTSHGLWVEDQTGLHLVTTERTTDLGPGTLVSASSLGVLSRSGGTLTLADLKTGLSVLQTQGDLPAAAVPDPADQDRAAGLVHAAGATLHVAWASGARQSIALGAAPDTLVPTEDGRSVLALDSAAGVIARVDLARGEVTEVIGDAGFAFGQALVLDGRLFLLAADASVVAVLNLAAAPDAPRWRRLTLGPPQDVLPGMRQLMTTPTRFGPVLALNPVNGLVSEIDTPEALGNAPQMSGFALRGGRPTGLATLTRSLRETDAPGIWQTRLALPAGAHELVVTAGIGLTLCLSLTVDGLVEATPTVQLTLADVPTSGSGHLRFRLEIPATVARPGDTASVTVAALGTGWRLRGLATADSSGLFTLPVSLPGPGLYAATPELAGIEAQATTFEVLP
jgi:hypothetical protein